MLALVLCTALAHEPTLQLHQTLTISMASTYLLKPDTEYASLLYTEKRAKFERHLSGKVI